MPLRTDLGRPALAPSILAADFGRLGEEIAAVTEAGADLIHVDVMDGHFVPNISIGPMIVEAARRATALPLDVHLMIEGPERYIPEFVQAGADSVSVHAETCPHLHRTIQLIKEAGAKACVALNPHTPIGALDLILDELDMVLLMSVNPGFGGQAFIPQVLEKVRALSAEIAARGLSVDIEVDGGVKVANSRALAEAGATVLVAGSAIFGADDYAARMSEMRAEIAREVS